ncbi:hypothetical protein AB0F72_25925 [Actinoplanes sp. NPDC023936]|uniref:hypothetical protein n=1 Tax=Actinoplanes sp. NPDC023936 TaxID=3154910 RepID=UPI0033C5A165
MTPPAAAASLRAHPLVGAAARLGVFVAIAAAGWATAAALDVHDLGDTGAYLHVVTSLLAIGLVASVRGIDLVEARRHVTVVVTAVTVGVLLKALLITAVMYAFFREPAFLVLGIAVAQIDPLSFAALSSSGDTSPRVRTLLAAWSAFDDPITVLLTVYLAGTLATGPAGASLPDLSSFGTGLLHNAAFIIVAYLLWRLTRIAGAGGRVRTIVQTLLLGALMAYAVWQLLMLGLAVSALFFRPDIGRLLDRLATAAFNVATFALGLLLAAGVAMRAGIVLGAAAFGAQIVVGSLVAVRFSGPDRRAVALGQQSGITAVLLALLLEKPFPGSVAVVAPAIVIVNVLHALANNLRSRPAPAAQPGASDAKSESTSVRTLPDSPPSSSCP